MTTQNSISNLSEIGAALQVAALNSFVDVFEFLVVDNVTTNENTINTDGYSFLTSDVPFFDETVTIVLDTGDDNDPNANNALEESTGVDFEWLAITTGDDGIIDSQVTMLDNGLLNITEYNEDGTAALTSTFYDLDDTEEWSILQVDADGNVTEIPDFEFSFFQTFDFGF